MQPTTTKVGSTAYAGWAWLWWRGRELWTNTVFTAIWVVVASLIVRKNWNGPAHLSLVQMMAAFPVIAWVGVSTTVAILALFPTNRKVQQDLRRACRLDNAMIMTIVLIQGFCLCESVALLMSAGA